MATLPPANWYQDPQAPDQLRYWDGAAWTAQVAPAPGVPTQPAAPQSTGLSRGEKNAIIAVVLAPILLGMLAAMAIPVYLHYQERSAGVSEHIVGHDVWLIAESAAGATFA